MFGRLRLRFVLISMLSVVVVLGVIISGINFLNYRSTVQRADEILLILKDNRGEFPPPPSDDHGMRAPGDSPEVAFEARYFSVVLDGEGGVVSSETGRIAALSPEQAEELAREVYGLNSDKGFSGDYRYLKSDEDGNVIIQLHGRKLAVRHNRLKLLVPASELYPPDYDFSIVFDTVANRKAAHTMDRKYDPDAVIILKEGKQPDKQGKD